MQQKQQGSGTQYSPDGRWMWNGHEWVPAPSPAGPPPPPGPGVAPRRRRRWPFFLAGAVVLLILIVVIANAGSGSRSSTSSVKPAQTGAGLSSGVAKPAAPAAPVCVAPCANVGGWIVQAANLRYGASSGNEFVTPESGNVFVLVDVTFINHTGSEQHANPTTFVLQDGTGVKHSIAFTTACPLWDAVNLTAGASLGPKCLAFQAAANRPTGLTLVWTPSLLGGDHSIKLS